MLSSTKSGLKVRENKVLGPYVDGLSQLAVATYQVPYVYFVVLYQQVPYQQIPGSIPAGSGIFGE